MIDASETNVSVYIVHPKSDEHDLSGEAWLHNIVDEDIGPVDTNNMTPPAKTRSLRP